MSSVDQVLVGRIGIAPAGQGNPTIILDSTTGTISGNFTINANTNFNAPNVNASFESLLLSDEDFPASSTADRLVVQLPNTNDVIKIGYQGDIRRENTSTFQENWVIGLPTANSGGVQCRFNTDAPNLQLYVPDNGGAVALYNSANSGYAWYLGIDGIASFNNVTHRGTSFFNGLTTCNANVSIAGPLTTINGLTLLSEVNVAGNIQVSGVVNASQLLVNGVPVEQDSAITVFVNSDFTVPDDGIDRELYISAGASNIIITLPDDPATQQHVNCVIFNAGTAPFIGFGDGTPSLSFVGGGAQTAGVNLLNAGPGGSSLANHWVRFKFVNYGVAGDWWQWSA